MENLEILDLRVNRIDNIDEFKHLKNLNNLKELYLSGNRKIKEHFITIKDILNQVKYFDTRIMKDHENIKHEIEEKVEKNLTPKNEINKKITLTTAKNKTTKLFKKVAIKNVINLFTYILLYYIYFVENNSQIIYSLIMKII